MSALSTDSMTVPTLSEIKRDDPISDISAGETIYPVRRALANVLPLWRMLVVKIVLAMIGVGCVLILPWPLKVIIDQVIMGIPPGESPTPYPPYVQPFIDQLIGLSPLGIVLAVEGFSLVLIFLIGAFGTGFQDSAQGGLAQGFDNATRSENMANESRSRVSSLLGLYEYRYQLRTTHLLNHHLRSDVFAGLMRMPMTRFSDVSIGDSVYRVMYDTPSVSNVCYNLLVEPLIIFAVMATVIWTTEHSFSAVPSVVWTAWAVTPLIFISMLTLTGITRRRALASRIAGSGTTATMEEGMANIAAVQALGAGGRKKQDFTKDSDNSFKQYRRYQLVLQGAYVLQAVIVIPLVFVVLFDIAEATIVGTLSPGDYGVLIAYFSQLLSSALALGILWINLQDNIAGLHRVFQVIDDPGDAAVHGHGTLADVEQGVSIDNVTFDYPDGSRALSEVTLEGRIGEMIALAGAAGALGFIDKLPQGFATRLGRGGGTLSVGQKQRNAIARGLVSRAPVLVLDEPTAALDPETENALVSALNAERHKRLLIVIAHRLSTTARADRIYFLDDGKVLESGSHEELMQRDSGGYREFVELQGGTAA